MPAPSDIVQFMRGQLFETPKLPQASFVGKTIVITGANTGLGFECARQCAHLNAATIVLGCRNVAAGEAAKEQILSAATSDKHPVIYVWRIDLEDYASVKAFANRMSEELPRCDALVANAGISTNEYQIAEGLERTLTVNVVSTFLLAMLSLPQLRRTAEIEGTQTHLTIVGSNVHCFADHTQLQVQPSGKVFERLSNKSSADMAARYFLSKLVVMQCAQELAAKTESRDGRGKSAPPQVIINCPSPGWCKTSLFRQDDGGFWGGNMLKLIGRTAEVGARTLTSAITAEPETYGQYLSECRVKPTSVFVRSEEGQRLQKELWAELIRIIGTTAPESIRGLQ